MAEDNKMVENNGGWQPSERLQKLAEKKGVDIPGIKKEESSVVSPVDVEQKTVVATSEEVEEMREAKKETIRVIFEKAKNNIPLGENEKLALESYQKSQKDILESLDTLLSEGDTKTDDYSVRYHKAKDALGSFGVEVNAYIKDKVEGSVEVGKRKKELLHIVDKMVKEEDLSVEEKAIAEKVGLHKVGLVNFEEDTTPTVVKDEDIKVEEKAIAEKVSPVKEQTVREGLNIKTEDDLNKKMAEINRISDPTAKINSLGRLASHLYDRGKIDWGNSVAEERTRQAEKKTTTNIIGLPENKESKTEWRKWARARMASLLDPLAREVNNARDVFGVISETAFGRQNVDGSLYMPKDISEEIVRGKSGIDGRIEISSEFQVSQEIGKLYSDWRKAHKRISSMVTAIEGGEYRLSDNRLNKRLLNELKNEEGNEDDGGSKNIAQAVRLYWAMAHCKEDAGKEILESYELSGIKSLFSNQLTDEEIGEIRSRIAQKCGGTYYENIGLMYASFFGVVAYGSDSNLPRIEYADAMGGLVHSEINRYKNEDEKYNSTRRGYRYLDDTVANVLYVIKDGKRVVVEEKDIPIEIGVHCGSLQTQVEMKEPRSFYILRPKNSEEKYVVVKKIGLPGTDYAIDLNSKFMSLNTDLYEEILFDDVLKEGILNEIDWGKSADISSIMISREKAAVNVYKMYKNLDDDLTKLNKGGLIARRETFEDAMPQYNTETQQQAMFLWLYSLINKNSSSWTKEKKDDLIDLVKDAKEQRLISKKQFDQISDTYDLGALGGWSSLVDGTYTPTNIFKSLFRK